MDEDDLEDLDSRGDEFADPDFIDVLQVFEQSDLVESHHNCDISELFESKDNFEGQVVYYAVSDNNGDIIGSIQFFYNEWLWRGFADEYKGQIDFDSGLLEVLYSEEEFKSLVEAVGTEYMMAASEERSIILKIPGEPDLEDIQEMLHKFVELSGFFHSRISNEKGSESFRKFTDEAN